MIELPVKMLTSWQGRFRFAELACKIAEDEPVGLAAAAAAVLDGLVAGNDELAAFRQIVSEGRFQLAETMLEECAVLLVRGTDDLRAIIESERANRLQLLAAELQELHDTAEVAGLPALVLGEALEEQCRQSWPTVAHVLEKKRKELSGRVEMQRQALDKRMRHADHLGHRSRDICTALLESGHLRAAKQLLDSSGEDAPLGPESIPLLRPWVWAESPDEVLQWHTDSPQRRPPSFNSWMPEAMEAKQLLHVLQDLSNGLSGATEAVASALNRFLCVMQDVQSEIHAVPGGSLAKLHNLFEHPPTKRFHPTGTVDLFVAEQGVTEIPAELEGMQPFVAIGPGLAEPAPTLRRSDVAMLGLRDVLRLVLQTQHRSVSLLRVLGAQWPLSAVSAGSAEQLRQLLEADPEARWRTVSWIVHLAGLGDPMVTDAIAFQTGLDADLLDLLLSHLVWSQEQPRRCQPNEKIRLWLRDQHLLAAAESRVLNPIRHSPAAVLAFWTALSAVPPGEPVSTDGMALALEIGSDITVPDAYLRTGLTELADLWLVSGSSDGSVTFQRCGALIALRAAAAARAADAARALTERTGERAAPVIAMTAWQQHEHVLSPELERYLRLLDSPGAALADTLNAREEMVAQTAALAESGPVVTGTADIVSVLDGMRRNFVDDHGGLTLVVDAPVAVTAAVRAEFLRFVIHALVENAAESLHDAGEGMIQVSVRTSYGDVVVDVRDSGPGIDLSADLAYRVFRSGFSTRGPGRGQGLYTARRLTQRVGGELDLVTAPPNHPILRGAHFRLVLPSV